jgi:hypothetical protein
VGEAHSKRSRGLIYHNGRGIEYGFPCTVTLGILHPKQTNARYSTLLIVRFARSLKLALLSTFHRVSLDTNRLCIEHTVERYMSVGSKQSSVYDMRILEGLDFSMQSCIHLGAAPLLRAGIHYTRRNSS